MSLGRAGCRPAVCTFMDNELGRLHAARNALEQSLMVLEQVLDEQQRRSIAEPELAARVEGLLAELREVNDRLTDLHCPPSEH